MSVTSSIPNLIQWIREHDDSKLFVILYIASAVILSIWLGIFWLVLVVFIHFIIELIKQFYSHNHLSGVLVRATWELKLDIALIIFALCIAVYMDVIIGAAGFASGARVVAQTGSRFAVWQRVIRGTLLSVDDLAQLSKFSSIKKENGHSEEDQFHKYIPSKLVLGDYISIFLGFLFTVLLVIAPFVTEMTMSEVISLIQQELRPFPN